MADAHNIKVVKHRAARVVQQVAADRARVVSLEGGCSKRSTFRFAMLCALYFIAEGPDDDCWVVAVTEDHVLHISDLEPPVISVFVPRHYPKPVQQVKGCGVTRVMRHSPNVCPNAAEHLSTEQIQPLRDSHADSSHVVMVAEPPQDHVVVVKGKPRVCGERCRPQPKRRVQAVHRILIDENGGH